MPTEQLDTVDKRVEHILASYKEARSDDATFLTLYLKRFHGIHLPSSLFANGVPTFETLTRARRRVQESGIHPATKHESERRRVQQNSLQVFGKR